MFQDEPPLYDLSDTELFNPPTCDCFELKYDDVDHLDFKLDDQSMETPLNLELDLDLNLNLDMNNQTTLPPDFYLNPVASTSPYTNTERGKVDTCEDKRPTKRRKQKGVTPIQKLNRGFRQAVKNCNNPLFPNNFVLTKKSTVYIRDCFQLFAQDICNHAKDIPNLISCYCNACGVYKNNAREEALMFLLMFFTNSRQIGEVLSMKKCINDQDAFTEYGLALLKRILWYYSKQIEF